MDGGKGWVWTQSVEHFQKMDYEERKELGRVEGVIWAAGPA